MQRLVRPLAARLALSLGAVQSGGGGAVSYRVDSVAGSDSNSGTLAAPFLTLAKGQAVVTAGQTLLGKTASTWREQFTVPASMSIGAYGSGAPPIIDARDVVPASWVRPDAAGQPTEWTISWTRANAAPTGTSLLGFWEDGVRPRLAASIADGRTNGGWYTTDRNTGSAVTITFWSATNPNSNGKQYLASKRDYCIYSYDGGFTTSIVGPLELIAGVAHYGSLSMGAGTVKQVLLRDGGIHHMVTKGSLTEDCIATEYDPDVAGIPFTAYRDTGAGFSPTFNRCLALFTGGASRVANGTTGAFYGHSAGNIDALTLTGCASRGMDLGQAGATLFTATGVYCEDAYTAALGLTGTTNVISYALVRETAASAFSGGSVAFRQLGNVTSTLGHSASYGAGVQLQQTNGTLTVANSAFVGSSGVVQSTAGALAATYSVFGGDTSITSRAGYTGNYNVFISGVDDFKGSFAGSGKFTLADWQSATGQDAQSVYVKPADQAAGNPYAFWLGVADASSLGPADGDFRINPAARVYSAADVAYVGTFPDGTLLTLAGPQGYYNWNTRAITAGPPPAYPRFPVSIAEMRAYITDPAAWAFYPVVAAGGTYGLDFLTPAYTFNGALQASWAAFLAASASTFARSTTAYYTDAAGGLTSFTVDAVRTGTAGLLLEPAATNLLTNSEAVGSWSTVYQATVTSDAGAAPNGASTADLVLETTANDLHGFDGTPAFTAVLGAAYTYSQYLKPNGRTKLQVSAKSTINSGGLSANFDLSGAGATSAVSAGATATIVALANGWYRISLTVVCNVGGQGRFYPFFISTGTTTSYTGDVTKGFYFWGAMVAAEAIVSSYIPTTGAAASRGADNLTLQLGSVARSETVTFDDNSTQVLAGRKGASVVSRPLNRALIKSLVAA